MTNQKPILTQIRLKIPQDKNLGQHPFALEIIKNLSEINFTSQVTFLIGENGSGKSTILEGIAYQAGFGSEGGSKNIQFKTSDERTYTAAEQLGECLTLSWRYKPQNGYFFRAESFFNLANYLDEIAKDDGMAYHSYGGKSLHVQSHGESFWSFFSNRLGATGFFIFDEPEGALSPQRQLALLVQMHEVCKNPNSQFIIATHSPILLAYPNATIYNCDTGTLTKIAYQETQHYKITKQFLDNPTRYLSYLFE